METIYTMKLTLKGEPRLLTIAVSEKALVTMVTDDKGNEIETIRQEGDKITITTIKK
jgi:hypothetical protein